MGERGRLSQWARACDESSASASAEKVPAKKGVGRAGLEVLKVAGRSMGVEALESRGPLWCLVNSE